MGREWEHAMINIDKALREQIGAFASANSKDSDEALNLAMDIHEKLWELELNDDMNGTNELGRLLEQHDITWIVEEYGLVGHENDLSL